MTALNYFLIVLAGKLQIKRPGVLMQDFAISS